MDGQPWRRRRLSSPRLQACPRTARGCCGRWDCRLWTWPSGSRSVLSAPLGTGCWWPPASGVGSSEARRLAPARVTPGPGRVTLGGGRVTPCCVWRGGAAGLSAEASWGGGGGGGICGRGGCAPSCWRTTARRLLPGVRDERGAAPGAGLGAGPWGPGAGPRGRGAWPWGGRGCTWSEQTIDEKWRSTLVKVKCGKSRLHNGTVSGLEITSSGDRIPGNEDFFFFFYIIIQNHTKRSKERWFKRDKTKHVPIFLFLLFVFWQNPFSYTVFYWTFYVFGPFSRTLQKVKLT